MATPRSININIRVRPREVRSWRAAARRADENLSEWIQAQLNVASIPVQSPRNK